MGWLKTIIGFAIGNSILGPIGGLIGAAIAHYLDSEKGERASSGASPSGRGGRGGGSANGAGANWRRANSAQQELVFLASAAAMMAKLAKADGHVSMSEIDSAERAFVRLGLSAEKREFCITVFRKAKEDEHTIFEYAQSFAAAQPDRDIRELFYDILWDLASADGTVSQHELEILDKITYALSVRRFQFLHECAKHGVGAASGGGRSQSGSSGSRARQSGTSLASAYRILGCSPSTTDADLKKAYREKAKKFHPDELAARGVSPELLDKATQRMAEINAAWDEIKKARGI